MKGRVVSVRSAFPVDVLEPSSCRVAFGFDEIQLGRLPDKETRLLVSVMRSLSNDRCS